MTPLQIAGTAPSVSNAGPEKCRCITFNLTNPQCHCGTSKSCRIGRPHRRWHTFVRAKTEGASVPKLDRLQRLDVLLLNPMPSKTSNFSLATCIGYHRAALNIQNGLQQNLRVLVNGHGVQDHQGIGFNGVIRKTLKPFGTSID